MDANEELKAGEQAAALAMWADEQSFTPEQAAAVKEQLKFYSIVPAEATRYAALTEAGLEAGTAYDLTSALSALTPLEGNSSVTDMQRFEAINAADISEREKIAAIGSIMGTEMTTESGGKSQYALLLDALENGYSIDEWLTLKDAEMMTESKFGKIKISGEYNISTDQYLRYTEQLITADALNADPEKRNNSYDQAEVAAAINSMLGLTNEQKAVLWQLQNKSWKATNNPFSASVGAEVKAALDAADDADGLSLPSLGGPARDTDQEVPALSLPSLTG